VTVIGGVLGNQDQFLDPRVAQQARIFQNDFHRPADGGTFDQRDGTECAWPPAAVGDFQVGTAALHSDARHVVLVGADGGRVRQMVDRLGVRRGAQFLHHVDDIHPAPRADDAVDAGYFLGYLLAVALGQTAGGDEQLAAFFAFSQVAQHVQRFLARRADKPAGVDDQQPCL